MGGGGGGGGWNGIGGLQHFNKNEGNNGGTVFSGRYWVALLTSIYSRYLALFAFAFYSFKLVNFSLNV